MRKALALAANDHRVQYAALPWRAGDRLEVLLITSRETERWVVPKGWPKKGRKAHETAAEEAFEEAGVTGRVSRTAVGGFGYGKRLADGDVIDCWVAVYPLEVTSQKDRWPERGQRHRRWFNPREAAALVEEPELQQLLLRWADAVEHRPASAHV